MGFKVKRGGPFPTRTGHRPHRGGSPGYMGRVPVPYRPVTGIYGETTLPIYAGHRSDSVAGATPGCPVYPCSPGSTDLSIEGKFRVRAPTDAATRTPRAYRSTGKRGFTMRDVMRSGRVWGAMLAL